MLINLNNFIQYTMIHLITFTILDKSKNQNITLQIYVNNKCIENLEHLEETNHEDIRRISTRVLNIHDNYYKLYNTIITRTIILNEDDDVPNLYISATNKSVKVHTNVEFGLEWDLRPIFNSDNLRDFLTDMGAKCGKTRIEEFIRIIKYKLARKLLLFHSKKVCYRCGEINCTHKCGICRRFYYCSKKCQQLDWDQHKIECNTKTENLRLFIPYVLTSIMINRKFYNNIEKETVDYDNQLDKTYGIPINFCNETIMDIKTYVNTKKKIMFNNKYKQYVLLDSYKYYKSYKDYTIDLTNLLELLLLAKPEPLLEANITRIEPILKPKSKGNKVKDEVKEEVKYNVKDEIKEEVQDTTTNIEFNELD